jgi:hypothetical protein
VTRRRRFRFGTVYCLRVYRRSRWTGRFRIARGYIGQTRYRDYRKRIDQHLYGYWYNGEWNPPKYWAHEVVDYYPLWQSDRWCDWGLDTREFLCIRVLFPLHNIIWNLGNPRRIIPPPIDQRLYPTPDQITAVERYPGKPRRPNIPDLPDDMQRTSRVVDHYQAPTTPRVFGGSFLVKWVVLAAVLLMFIPGYPGWDLTVGTVGWVTGGVGWGVTHGREMGGLLVLGVVAWLLSRHQPRRRRTTRTRTRRPARRRKTPLF